MNNKQIKQILLNGKALHKGTGGASLQIEIEDTPVFVKKIPITDLELQPDHYMSTSNIFNLPMYYQYGIGSAGFSAWRELNSHIITTNWVITGKCLNFPKMYHWRILKSADKKIISDKEKTILDHNVTYWGNNQSIRHRLNDLILASHHMYLFIEFIPNNLYDWLNQQIAHNEKETIISIQFIKQQMQNTHDFMRSQNFLHMDVRLENILTNGKQLFYSDFGLALSDKFTLKHTEIQFMQNHASYDYASGIFNLLYSLIISLNQNKLSEKTKIVQNLKGNAMPYGEEIDQFKIILNHYISEPKRKNIGALNTFIREYAPITMEMINFLLKIQQDCSSMYPNNLIYDLLNKMNKCKHDK